MYNWSRNEKIALISLLFVIITCIAAIAVVPEVRRWFGLETYSTDSRPDSKNQSNSSKDRNINSTKYGRIFNPNDPFPIGFDRIKSGTRISVVQSIYPSPKGSLGNIWYDLNIDSGPFKRVTFWHDAAENDPRVTRFTFSFRDPDAARYTREQALATFGSDSVISKVMGKILVWPDVNGYEATIGDDEYKLAPIPKQNNK